MKRLAITGANGFIGQNLIRFFQKTCAEFEIVTIERSLEVEQITKQLSNSSVVINLSSLFIAEHQPQDIGPLIESHIHFGTCLLEAVAKAETPHFLQISSVWQHSHDQGKSPANLYAAMKAAFEQILKYYVSSFKLNALCLELPDTFGPQDPRDKLLNKISRALLASDRELQLTAGQQEVDLLHIKDVVKGIALATERLCLSQPHSFERYRLSSGEMHTVQELVALALQAARKSRPAQVDALQLNWGALPYRKREVFHAPQTTPCLPEFKTETKLRDTLEDFFLESRSSSSTTQTALSRHLPNASRSERPADEN